MKFVCCFAHLIEIKIYKSRPNALKIDQLSIIQMCDVLEPILTFPKSIKYEITELPKSTENYLIAKIYCQNHAKIYYLKDLK